MEGALKYHREVNIDDHTSVGKISRWIDPGSVVLEIGPATGIMTAILSTQLQCEVYAVEIDEEAARRAEPYTRKMVVGNIERLNLEEHFSRLKFDVIIFADVLEHLIDPWKVLAKISAFLKPGGQLLASIPNIGHAGLILDLINGHFTYRRDGLLDETHLRFFTRESVAEMFQRTGYQVIEWNRTQLDPEFTEFKNSLKNVPKPVRDLMAANPDWNTYQFLVRTRFSPGDKNAVIALETAKSEVIFPESQVIQVFFDTGQGISEDVSVTQLCETSQAHQEVTLEKSFSPAASVTKIRLDPSDSIRIMKARSLTIWDEDIKRFEWHAGDILLSSVASFQNLNEVYVRGDSFLIPRNEDPQIFIDLPSLPTTEKLKVVFEWDFAPEALHAAVDAEVKVRGELQERLDAKTASLSSVKEALDVTSPDSELALHVEDVLAELKKTREEKESIEAQFVAAHELLYSKEVTLFKIRQSRSWKMTEGFREMMHRIRRILDLRNVIRKKIKKLILNNPAGLSFLESSGRVTEAEKYEVWLSNHELSHKEIVRLTREQDAFKYRPLISIVIPAFNSCVPWLREAIESVRNQTYNNWELCIADDCSTVPGVVSVLKEYSIEDPRIKVVFCEKNGHISQASNAALSVAKGEFIAFVDHDDVLTRDALSVMVKALNEDSEADVLYSDEDKLDESGRREEPTFKPEWSPDYFQCFMYMGHLALYRHDLVKKVGGFRVGFEGSQDYDLALRVARAGARIRHVPGILYHWRKHPDSVACNHLSKPYAFTAAVRALQESVRAGGDVTASVENTVYRGIYRVRRTLPASLKIGIITFGPKRSEWRDFLEASNQKDITYHHIPLEGVWHQSLAAELKKSMSQVEGDFIVLAHTEIAFPKEGWREALFEPLLAERTVACGPKYTSYGGPVLNAGYSILPPRITSNFHGADANSPGYAARLITNTNVSALSLRCLAVKKSALLAALTTEQFTSPEALEIAISLSLIKQGDLICTAHLMVNSPSSHFRPIVNLSEEGEDLELLNRLHKIQTFKDRFYPKGLDGQKGNFKIAIS